MFEDGRSRRRLPSSMSRRRSPGLSGRLVPRSLCRVLSMIFSRSSRSLFVRYPRWRIRSRSGGVDVLGIRSTVNVDADCWPWAVVGASGRGDSVCFRFVVRGHGVGRLWMSSSLSSMSPSLSGAWSSSFRMSSTVVSLSPSSLIGIKGGGSARGTESLSRIVSTICCQQIVTTGRCCAPSIVTFTQSRVPSTGTGSKYWCTRLLLGSWIAMENSILEYLKGFLRPHCCNGKNCLGRSVFGGILYIVCGKCRFNKGKRALIEKQVICREMKKRFTGIYGEIEYVILIDRFCD